MVVILSSLHTFLYIESLGLLLHYDMIPQRPCWIIRDNDVNQITEA